MTNLKTKLAKTKKYITDNPVECTLYAIGVVSAAAAVYVYTKNKDVPATAQLDINETVVQYMFDTDTPMVFPTVLGNLILTAEKTTSE